MKKNNAKADRTAECSIMTTSIRCIYDRTNLNKGLKDSCFCLRYQTINDLPVATLHFPSYSSFLQQIRRTKRTIRKMLLVIFYCCVWFGLGLSGLNPLDNSWLPNWLAKMRWWIIWAKFWSMIHVHTSLVLNIILICQKSIITKEEVH